MAIFDIENGDQLLEEYRNSGDKPVIFYFYTECNMMCDDFNQLFDNLAEEFSDRVTIFKINFISDSILEGTDMIVESTPTVTVGINGVEQCDDRLAEDIVTEENVRAVFEKYV